MTGPGAMPGAAGHPAAAAGSPAAALGLGGGVPPPTIDSVTESAAQKIRARIPDAIVEESLGGKHPFLRVTADRLVDACRLLRDEMQMDCCHLISGVDWPAKTPAEGKGSLEAVYHLVSYSRKVDAAYRRQSPKNDAYVCLKVRVPRDNPEVPSVMSVWAGADWHERETWDLLGIRFTGRGPVRRILLPEDWPGHPLRKDWEYPTDYHGVPIIPPEGL